MSKDRGNQRLIPTIRFKGFTDDWEQRKFGELFVKSTEKNISLVYTAADVLTAASMTDTDRDIKSDNDYMRTYNVIHRGDILFEGHTSKKYAFGRFILNDYRDGIVSHIFDVYRPKVAFNQAFIKEYIHTERVIRPLLVRSTSNARMLNALNKSELANQRLLLTCMDEQQSIGHFLSLLNRTIALHQRKYENLQAVKKELLKRMFASDKKPVPDFRFNGYTNDWEQRKLGEVAEIVGGGTPSTSKPEYWDGDIDWYAPAEIGTQRYVQNSQKKITDAGLKGSSARMLPVGTVLFTSRAGIGKTAILARIASTNQGFQSIVPVKNELDSYFIFSRTKELKRYGEVNGAGSTFVEVSGKTMAKMPINIPSMMEQQKIGHFFQRLDDTIALHQRKLEDLKQLKKVLLQKLFV